MYMGIIPSGHPSGESIFAAVLISRMLVAMYKVALLAFAEYTEVTSTCLGSRYAYRSCRHRFSTYLDAKLRLFLTT